MEHTIFIRVSQIDSNSERARHCLWYKIHLAQKVVPFVIEESEYDGPSKKPIAAPYNRASSDCHSWSGSAACNSKLYMIGGDLARLDVTSESQDEVYVCSATKATTDSSAWQKYPVKLTAKRHNPVAIAIQNDIYIFGTVARPSGSPIPWAEKIDTTSDTINPLNAQPSKSSICAGFVLCSAVVNTNFQTKILLATSHHCYNGPSRLLYYFVEDGRWEDVTKSHPNFFHGGPALSVRSAVIDGVLYTYHYKSVYAYDLENREWFDHPVLGLLEEEQCYYQYDNNRGFVLDLGNGKLCVGFCTSFPLGEDQKAKLLLHYAMFTPYMDKKHPEERSGRSIGTLVHSKGYCVLHGMHFTDAMIMKQAHGMQKI